MEDKKIDLHYYDYENEEEDEEGNKIKRCGKKANQRLKAYLVMRYLLQNSDEKSLVSGVELERYLKEDLGIYAERRSIYKDIEEINIISWMLEHDENIKGVNDAINNNYFEKLIEYKRLSDKNLGFYVKTNEEKIRRIQLIAECIYASKFINKENAEVLIDTLCEMISSGQRSKIESNAIVVGRVRTTNKYLINDIYTIKDAMAEEIDGKPHTPHKISFTYQTHDIRDVEKLIPRKRKYVVSPFQLVINDGNYYLLAYDEKYKKIVHYRVDRMKNVEELDIPREGETEFQEEDLTRYTQSVFSMYKGTKCSVRLRFTNNMLDTVIDRFGTKNIRYIKSDDTHFHITVGVEISDQFFAWVAGFKNQVLIETPEIAEQYKEFLDKIREMY